MEFESGVRSYIKASATVIVSFPVDYKGNAAICCTQCPYLRRQSRVCALNGALVAYPEHYVGEHCPLNFIGEEENNGGL